MEKRQQDETISGVGYVLNFARNVNSLNDTLASYLCLMLEMDAKHSDDKSILPEERQACIGYAQALRKFISLTYTGCKALASTQKKDKFDTKKLGELYEATNKEIMPKRKEAQEYTDEINLFLVKSTISRLLETSEQFVNEVFSDVRADNQ